MYRCVESVYSLRENFILLGVTGRTGSGCTTASEILTSEESGVLNINVENMQGKEKREFEIIKKFSKIHWKSFYRISFSDIISSFILEASFEEASDYLNKKFSINIDDFKNDYIIFYENNKIINELCKENIKYYDDTDEFVKLKKYVFNDLKDFTNRFKEYLNNNSQSYIKVYQKIGDNIRTSGCAFIDNVISTENVFSICRRINTLIKVIRRRGRISERERAKNYFVLDAFRNPLEVLFFRERYAAFYLIAISCSERSRQSRLFRKRNFNLNDIESIDGKEVGKDSILDSFDRFVGQDIKQCVSMSDIYINNKDVESGMLPTPHHLLYQLVRLVSLIQHPGLVKPSRDEFLMQLAFAAANNSGCLSRNVGALVSDSCGDPLAIGWNCVPSGQIPCYLRSVKRLEVASDTVEYSFYEKNNDGFKKCICSYDREILSNEHFENSGLPSLYCFKKIKNNQDGQKNQVHTRALHAEENAFLQVAKHGNNQIKGGTLFTSASPCVLCAKKAYQFGISRIVYIDPYPDISEDHILSAGKNPIEMSLYDGAIGMAYYKLYTPMISIKDEVEAFSKSIIIKKSDN